MKTRIVRLAAVVIFVIGLMGGANAYGLDFLGENLTIWDGMGSQGSEDNEIESPTAVGQAWDLEAFFLNTSTNVLTMVAGYDFKDGYQGTVNIWKSGDIFFNYLTPAPTYGVDNYSTTTVNGNVAVSNSLFGYDYALRMDFSDPANPQWMLYELTDSSTLLTSYYRQFDAANPWKYDSGGQLVSSGSFKYYSNLADAQVENLMGNWTATQDPVTGEGPHYAVQFDLDDVFGGYVISSDNYFHYTMQCGNDSMMGQDPGIPFVPEPATVLLLGGGLIGLFGLGRKRLQK